MRSSALKAGISTLGTRLPAHRTFERELELLESIGGRVPVAEEIEHVRKALGHANNYLVAKAARIVEENALMALKPEVLSAYERFFQDAVKSDPQCWAKNALVKALVKLDCRDPEVYLRGLRHTQEEPVWGGQSDTAGALRGTCTHALVACEGLSSLELLDLLIRPMTDSDKTVRVEAARAIGHVGGASAALLMKLSMFLRKEEPEVLGACFSSLLGMERSGNGESDRLANIACVAEFLEDEEEIAAEAALALAETHHPAALTALLERRRKGAGYWFATALDQAIVLTRLPEAMDFLLSVIERDPRHADSALEAISRVNTSAEARMRVALAVKKANSDRVFLAFRQHFPEVEHESGMQNRNTAQNGTVGIPPRSDDQMRN